MGGAGLYNKCGIFAGLTRDQAGWDLSSSGEQRALSLLCGVMDSLHKAKTVSITGTD